LVVCNWSRGAWAFRVPGPRAGSGVVRIDPLRFLAGYRTRRLNQAISFLYLSMFYCVVLYYGPHFYVLLVFINHVFCLLVVWVKLSLLAK